MLTVKVPVAPVVTCGNPVVDMFTPASPAPPKVTVPEAELVRTEPVMSGAVTEEEIIVAVTEVKVLQLLVAVTV